MVLQYSIVPQKSWGKMPLTLIDTWRKKSCDSFFIANSKRASSQHCSTYPLPAWHANLTSIRFHKDRNGKDTSSLEAEKKYPVIAILAGSTTRSIANPSLKTLALCNYLLKSILRTAECGFHYIYVLGYDLNDKFYSDPKVVLFLLSLFLLFFFFSSSLRHHLLILYIRI